MRNQVGGGYTVEKVMSNKLAAASSNQESQELMKKYRTQQTRVICLNRLMIGWSGAFDPLLLGETRV